MIVTNSNKYFINKLIKIVNALRHRADKVNKNWEKAAADYCISIDDDLFRAQTLIDKKYAKTSIDMMVDAIDNSPVPLWAIITKDLSKIIIKDIGSGNYFSFYIPDHVVKNISRLHIAHICNNTVNSIFVGKIDIFNSSLKETEHISSEYLNEFTLAPIFKHNDRLDLPDGVYIEAGEEIDDILTSKGLW